MPGDNDIVLGEIGKADLDNPNEQQPAPASEQQPNPEDLQNPSNQNPTPVDTPENADANNEFDIDFGTEQAPENPTPEKQEDAKPITDWKEALKDKSQQEIFEAIGYTPEELDDFEKGLIQHRKNGGDTSEYLFHKTKDWDKEDDISLIEMKYKRENPGLTEEQITKLIVDKYKLETNEDGEFIHGEKERELAAIQMKVDSNPERAYQKDLSSKFQIKERQQPAANNNQPQQTQQEIVEGAKQSLIAVPEIKSMVDNKKVVMSIEGIGKFNLPVQNPDEFIDFMAGGESNLKHRVQDGKVNMENEILANMILRYGGQKVIGSIVKAAKGQATKAIVEENRNISTEVKPKEVFTPDNKVTNFSIGS